MNESQDDIKVKMLPHNDEAERAILGALLLNPEAYDQISDIIKAPEYFYRPNHQVIYEAIGQILEGANGNSGLDLLTLTDYLKKKNLLKDAGGISYIAQLTNSDAIVSHIQQYAEMVKEARQRRELYKVSVHLSSDAFDSAADIKETLDQGAKDLTDLYMDLGKSSKDYSLGSIVMDTYQKVLARIAGEASDDKIASGFSVLDKYCNGGFSPEDYIIIAARPSIGKTAFAISMMLNMINDNKKIAFFSLEMPGDKIAKRLLSMVSKVPTSKINTANLIGDDFDRFNNAAEKLYGKSDHLFIVDVPNISMTDLRGKARSLHKEHHLDAIVIDYIGLISLANARGDMPTHERVSQISKGIKSLARELKVPFVVLCQVSRDSEEKAPILSNLRDSGSIEQDADVVCFLHRKRSLTEEEKLKNAKDNEGRATLQVTKLIVAKNRDGETGEFKIGFHDQLTSYVDLASQDAEFVEPTPQDKKR